MKWLYGATVSLLVLYGAVVASAILSDRHLYDRSSHQHDNQCVVCKPSGKLAMWGECE